MKLENQVVSLELAQKMKELGFKQESLFNWIEENQFGDDWDKRIEMSDYEFDCPIKILASAYTVAELGEMLPEKVVFRNYQKRTDGTWRMNWGDLEISGDTEANMKAKMLIYLKENNLI